MEKQPEPAAMSAAQFSPRGNKAAAPTAYTANSRVRRLFWIGLPVGFAVLVLCMLAGEQAKMWLHVPIPGNVLGLFILFLCFRLRLIPPELIEEAANRLLYILPALFIPIYVSAIGRGQLWSKISWFLLPALLAATAVLWMFVGHLAQYLLRRPCQNERVA